MKRIIVFLAAITGLLTACQNPPESGGIPTKTVCNVSTLENTPQNTGIAYDTPSVTAIPTGITSPDFPYTRYSIGELYSITEKHMDKVISNKLFSITIKADIDVPQVELCPIIQCMPYAFDKEKVLNLYFAAQAGNVKVQTTPNKPFNSIHYRLSDLNVAILPQGMYVEYYTMDLNNIPQSGLVIKRIESGNCGDQMVFSRDDAVKMAMDEIKKAGLPFDVDHPVIKAFSTNIPNAPCYYAIRFMRYYDGIPVCPGSFNRGGVDGIGIMGEFAKVTIYPKGVWLDEFNLYNKAKNIISDVPLISLNTAVSIIEKNLSVVDRRLIKNGKSMEIKRISLQYVQWAKEEYYTDNSYQPCWVFIYEDGAGNEHSLRINAYDATFELGNG